MSDAELDRQVHEAVKRLRARGEIVKLDDLCAELRSTVGAVGTKYDVVDRSLQRLKRRGLIEYRGKRDPQTGEVRKTWGWCPKTKTKRSK